jgi:hypothetical protein
MGCRTCPRIKNSHCAVVAVLPSPAKSLNGLLRTDNYLLTYQEFPCCCEISNSLDLFIGGLHSQGRLGSEVL